MGEEVREVRHHHEWAKQPPEVKIKLIRGAKSYQWEIQVSDESKNMVDCMLRLKALDAQLRADYSVEEEKA